MNYEIGLRKLTFTTVKADCALFKQKKLTIQEKKRNLNSLISTQLEFKTQADMVDLERAIKESADVHSITEEEEVQPVPISLAENVNVDIASEDI